MIGSLAVLLGVAVAAAGVPNPLVDPGFEAEGTAGALSAWSDCGERPATLQSATVHGGRFAVTLEGGAAICQRVVMPMARSILLDFWEKPTATGTDANAAPAYREVSFYDKLPDGKMDMIQTIVRDPIVTSAFAHYTFDVTALMGQTLYVYFGVRDGSGTHASLVLDDVTIQAERPMEDRS